MPTYIYKCECGYTHEHFHAMRLLGAIRVLCDECGKTMTETIITAPLLVKASADVCYDSPIDGKPITTMAARQEDLKRNNCTPYDPEQKTDYHRRIQESESALDKTIETAVEAAIEKMPTKKRGKLCSELTEQGMNADVIRTTGRD